MADPNSTEYTPDELAALPQTTQVFEAPKLKIKDHEWLQRGQMIEDNCNPQRMDCVNAGIPIPFGKMLVKVKGAYDLVPEPTPKSV